MSRPSGGKALERLILTRRPPIREGLWLDCYNCIYNEEICGTITTRIDAACEYFVTELSTD
jgi:hypothetical protein